MSRIIIRHAEKTTHHAIDPPIKDSELDLDYEYDLIICSPYRRCRETADVLNIDNKTILIDVRLSEYLQQPHRNKIMDPESLLYGEIPGYGEEWEEFARRVKRFWRYITQKSKYKDQRILIVTHGIVVNYLHQIITGKKLYQRGRNVPYVGGFVY